MTMVGREPEFARLVELLSSAESATGGFAVVTGEAGIGKTRLVTDGQLWPEAEADRLVSVA
jgi:predicted ATPase